MKPFKNQPIFTLIFILLIITGTKPALSQPGYDQPGYGQPANQYPQPGPGAGQGQQVTVYDQGLRMPVGSYTVPAGWNIVQDVATDPNTGQPIKQKLDITGPQGELMRSLGMAQYAPMMGTNFEQSWRQMAMSGLQGELNQANLGNLAPSARMQRNQMLQQYAQTVASQGFKLECLEASVSGSRNGQPYQGVVSIVHLTPANMPDMGTIQVSLTLSPANQLPSTLTISEQIANSFQPNPQYQQRLQQIQQKAMGSYGNYGQNYPDNVQNSHQDIINQIRQQNPNEYPAQGYDPYQPQPNDQMDYYPADVKGSSQQQEWY